MLFTVTVIVFAVAVGGSLIVTFVLPNLPRRQPLPTSDIRHPTSKQRQLTTTTRPVRARPAINYAAERELIRLALSSGWTPGQVWPLLRGSPSARRRRVLKVARELARPAVQPKLEAAHA